MVNNIKELFDKYNLKVDSDVIEAMCGELGKDLVELLSDIDNNSTKQNDYMDNENDNENDNQIVKIDGVSFSRTYSKALDYYIYEMKGYKLNKNIVDCHYRSHIKTLFFVYNRNVSKRMDGLEINDLDTFVKLFYANVEKLSLSQF